MSTTRRVPIHPSRLIGDYDGYSKEKLGRYALIRTYFRTMMTMIFIAAVAWVVFWFFTDLIFEQGIPLRTLYLVAYIPWVAYEMCRITVYRLKLRWRARKIGVPYKALIVAACVYKLDGCDTMSHDVLLSEIRISAADRAFRQRARS